MTAAAAKAILYGNDTQLESDPPSAGGGPAMFAGATRPDPNMNDAFMADVIETAVNIMQGAGALANDAAVQAILAPALGALRDDPTPRGRRNRDMPGAEIPVLISWIENSLGGFPITIT